ncbi:hypothetical protein [Coleofasciculus sp. F4-SAH-05]|uniref:hypothetical protein n=1 Tax=Coleofasciculus sp. F4-SAH-05 TaxID=3069525 RepID=UPI0032F5F6D4
MICSCKEFQRKYPDCTVCSQGKKITAQENKRKYILNNPSGKQVCKVKIDDCVIKSQEQRKCDYLYFKSKITGKVFARVVLSRVPSPKIIEVNPGVIKLRKLLKKYSGNFAYSSRQYENDTI